jgi:Gpi18-like mannosyltransferase
VAGVCAAVIAALMYRQKNLSAKGIVFISLACVLLLPYFLPRMHERYFYLADLFSVLYALYDPKRWYIPVLVVTSSSFIAYMGFLSQVSWFAHLNIGLIIPSIIDLVAIILLIVVASSHENFIQAAHSDQI